MRQYAVNCTNNAPKLVTFWLPISDGNGNPCTLDEAMAPGGGRAWAQPSIYEAVPNSRRISGMARLHLATFKLARVIPIAGWAARFYGKSSHGLWMLDKSALFTRKSLKINELWITRCAQKPISPSLKKCGIPCALIRCSLFLRLPLFKCRHFPFSNKGQYG